jgi:uncharacterized protein YcaQ
MKKGQKTTTKKIMNVYNLAKKEEWKNKVFIPQTTKRLLKMGKSMKKKTKQEAWEDKLYDIFCDSVRDNKSTYKEVKPFISQLLEAQQGELYAWFNKALLKQKQEIEDKEFERRRTAKIKTAEAGGEMCELRLKKQKQEIIEEIEKSMPSHDAVQEIIKRLTDK